MRIIARLLAFAAPVALGLISGLMISGSLGQSLPNVPGGLGLYYGYPASAENWNAWFQAKQDWIGANPFTVSTLPACGSSNAYYWAMVTDATSPTFNGALTGGGTVKVPVWCNGTAWTSH
jgi:hypothetical protein